MFVYLQWRNPLHHIEKSFAHARFKNYRFLGHLYPFLGHRQQRSKSLNLFKLKGNEGLFDAIDD
jgi:hypothetical protein